MQCDDHTLTLNQRYDILSGSFASSPRVAIFNCDSIPRVMSLVSFSALLGFRSPTAFRHQHLKICPVSFSNYTYFPNSGLVAQWLEYHTHCSYVCLVICRYDVSVGGQSSGLCTETRILIEIVPFSEDLLTHTQNYTMKIAMEQNYCFNLRGSRPWEGWGSNAYNTCWPISESFQPSSSHRCLNCELLGLKPHRQLGRGGWDVPCAAYSSARIDKLAAVVHVEEINVVNCQTQLGKDAPCHNLYYVSIR